MLQQNWFVDPKFEMFEDYGDAQSFYDTETKNIYVVMAEYGQKGSNTIQEITPDVETFNKYLEDNDLPIAFGNSDFVRIYKRIVGDSKGSDILKNWMEQNE